MPLNDAPAVGDRTTRGAALAPARFLWATRVAWVAAAVATGLAISSAAAGRSGAAGTVGAVAWWATVAAVVVGLVVPSTVGLVVLRMAAPASVAGAALCLAFGASTATGITALALTTLAMLLAFSGETGEAMVQGAAYGAERRYPLRPPAAVLLPAALSCAVWSAAVLAAVLALAGRQWVLGGALAVAAVPFTWFLGVRLHRLACRWLVLVPAGLVLHDAMVLGETLMVQRGNLALARLALTGTEAADLTGPAAGHAVEVSAKEMVLALFPSSRAHPQGRAVHVQSFLVAPTRPGRALSAIAALHVPLG
jgi:hypothetical protein